MDKKSSNVRFVIRLTVILAFFAVMLFPLCMMALDGPDQTEMDSEAATTLEPLTLQNWLEAEFQQHFESWFSAHYPLRSSIVTAFRQMRFDVENSKSMIELMQFLNGTLPGREEPDDDPGTDTPSDGEEQSPVNIYLDPNNIYAEINQLQMEENQKPVEPVGYKGNDQVYIGKSGYLYEAPYIHEYYGYSAPYNTVTDDGLVELRDELEYIQEELEKRGITMLYIISSSKASAYSEFIPEYFKNMNVAPADYVRPIERWRELLAESDINYLDSAPFYEEIGLLVTFPKTGIHWNALASFESTAELIRMYQDITNEQTVTLSAIGVNKHSDAPSSFNNEKDIFSILYGSLPADSPYRATAITDTYYYSPKILVRNEDAPKLNVLVQGGSFTHSIVHYLENYGVANVTQCYYNGGIDWNRGPDAWESLLQNKDLIIFEATEQQIRGEHKSNSQTWPQAAGDGNIGHNVVYDSLYEYLKAHEGEY